MPIAIPYWTEIKMALIALAFVGAAGFSAFITHKVDASAMLALENQYKQAQLDAVNAAKAEQERLDKIGSDADKAQIELQQNLLDTAAKRLAAIPSHVTRGAHNCITWGLAATIDAAALDVDVDAIAIPAGKKLSDCSNLNAATLAKSVAGNYGHDQRNAARLAAAQAYIDAIAGVKR